MMQSIKEIISAPCFALQSISSILLICTALFWLINPIRRLNRLYLKLFTDLQLETPDEKIMAFFHPYCDMGGGGERVLWIMINAILNNKNLCKKYHICIYS